MKKIIAIAAVVASLGSSAFAAGYGSAGCGLGSLVFKNNNWTQILAATTNGTFGSQTFGITFGTSECNSTGMINVAMARESFIEANYKDLARNAAVGNGEYVANLAKLYGYNAENTQNFGTLLQKNYSTIFAANDAKVAVTEINKLVSNI